MKKIIKIIVFILVMLIGFSLYYYYKIKTSENINNYTIEQLQDLRRVDGIVEPVYTQDCFPRTLQQNGVTKDCFERANLGQNEFCTDSEINKIKEYYEQGQENDPFNDGSGQFCAEE